MASVSAIVGLPGCGKSYSSVELYLLPALQQNRRIVTNITLKLDAIKKDFPNANIYQFSDFLELDFDDIGGGCLFMIDEAWRLWPAGLTAAKIPTKQLAVINEHRHRSDSNGRSMDVVIIAQDLADIAQAIRAKIETTVINVKHLDLGVDTAYRRDYYRGAIKGQKGPTAAFIRSENGKYLPNIYQYYKTHMHSDGGSDVKPDESRIIKSSIWYSNKVRAGAVVLVLCLIGLFFSLRSTSDYVDSFKAKKKQPEQIAQTAKSSPVKTVSQTETKPPKEKPKFSTTWKIAGVFYNYGGTGKDRFILADSNKNLRHIEGSHCKKVEYEDYCTVDDEIVTFFSGSSGSAGGESTLLPPASNDLKKI
jgi:zona occludens toxin